MSFSQGLSWGRGRGEEEDGDGGGQGRGGASSRREQARGLEVRNEMVCFT
jgi:hypothetical protein